MENNLKKVATRKNQWDEILESEHYLLHSVDIDSGHFGFIKTSRMLLSSASFIDGRSQISADQILWPVPIEHALIWYDASNQFSRPNRFIFHSAFCGSTLLARVLDIQGKTFVHKEPSILAQLADLKTARNELYLDTEYWTKLIRFILGQLNSPWSGDELNLIKPSNWVNSELRDLITLNGPSKLVLLSQSPTQYLTAVFRGGGERIKFVYSFLSQIRPIFPEFHDVINEVENGQFDTVNLFARLMVVSYAIQARAFSQAKGLVNEQDIISCNYDELMEDSTTSIFEISKVLELDLTPYDIEMSITRRCKIVFFGRKKWSP